MLHDPLCHAAQFAYHDPECCDCALIAKARADERERIAQAIEAARTTWDAALTDAARISRNGGTL